jgi:inorganic pyrophosphatase
MSLHAKAKFRSASSVALPQWSRDSMDKTFSTYALQPFFERTQLVNILIDTPKAAPFKLKFDEKAKVFRVHKAMPLGFAFPFNFEFVPSTSGGDGDPLDVLLLTDFVLPTGALILGKLISVLEAE